MVCPYDVGYSSFSLRGLLCHSINVTVIGERKITEGACSLIWQRGNELICQGRCESDRPLELSRPNTVEIGHVVCCRLKPINKILFHESTLGTEPQISNRQMLSFALTEKRFHLYT